MTGERDARERTKARRAKQRTRRRAKRLNQRERARNLSKRPIVAMMPGPPRATAGQQSGRIGWSGGPSRWVREALDRQLAEAAAAAAART